MTTTTHGARPRLPVRLGILCAGIATILMVWLYRDDLHGWILLRGTLANDAPTLELFEEYLRQSPEPSTAILDAWNTGKIVHRQFAMRQLSAGNLNGKSLSLELEAMLLSGALDPDMNVRESALQGLQRQRHPALPALAAVQLRDLDPEIRLLGLDHLKHAPPGLGVAQVAPLVDDPDPRVAARAIKLLEQWSGKDFDVKLADAVEVTNPDTGLKGFRPEGIDKVRAASGRAQEWLSRHSSDYPAVRLEAPQLALASLQPIPAGDFVLPTLEGRKVRLSDYHGQVVLINFWTTWCTACLAEIPALVELQKRHGEKLVILGISLDHVPDGHGHTAGHEPGLSDGTHEVHEDAGHDHEDYDAPSFKEIRAKVARTAKKLGINYTVLMDESNEVGGRFNGGELPTTVLVDPQGNVRRRFVGARPLPVFEAMLAEVLPRSTAGERQDLEHLKQEIRARFPSVRTISTADLAASLERPAGDHPLLLDVRAAEEFAVSHLPGAELASNPTDAIARIEAAQPVRVVVLYCSVGYRSADAASRLQAQGYTNVFNLEGSIFQWANEGRPLFRGEMPVKVVHPFDNDWGRFLNRELWCFASEDTPNHSQEGPSDN